MKKLIENKKPMAEKVGNKTKLNKYLLNTLIINTFKQVGAKSFLQLNIIFLHKFFLLFLQTLQLLLNVTNKK